MRVSRHLWKLDLLIGLLGLALIGLGLVGSSASAATPAADSTADGSDWGSQGQLSSDSSQTAAWDNVGNSALSSVPRNAQQKLLHTDDKTYADVSASDQSLFAGHFGADNGLGGLQVSVSQTEQLVSQSITVSISGALPDIPRGGGDSNTYFQIFQCWGAQDSSGAPSTTATSPDPATCQVGALGPDSVGNGAKREQRIVGTDPLVGGDWKQYISSYPPIEVPFLAIDGTPSTGTFTDTDSDFTHASTNEYSHVTVPASGATSRQFDVQTGTESQGLGCGARSDEPSTPTCWLVVVPRVNGVDDGLGPISPTVWAERMQFQLGFQPIPTFCPSGSDRSSTVGSEMLSRAANSWIPGVCDTKDVALGYTKLGDDQARSEYAEGAADAVLTSSPVTSPAGTGIPVPLTLTAPVIAFNFDYHPACTSPNQLITKVSTDADAVKCGYQDLAALQADLALAGQPVHNLRLDATLVAKLLTMSYSDSMLSNGLVLPQWTTQRPQTLTADPEFLKLNPQLHLYPDATDIASMVLEGQRSDAATEIWNWIEADPAASSFLSGCPDAYGVVINPYFSTRTYTGCPADAAALAAQSVADRQATTNPAGFIDLPLTYPPDGLAYPLPQWQEQPAVTDSSGTVTQTVRTLNDKQPRVNDMTVAARDTFIGYKPENGTFCTTYSDEKNCSPAPGKWKDDKAPQRYGSRQVFTITDASSAARYQLPTASLCSDDGADCVAADTTSLQAAADRFQPSSTAGYLQPGAADYADGAYPLTLPVYATVRASLPLDSRTVYADSFDYITEAGQVPGYAQGTLPPGYAPLTSDLEAEATAAITQLRLAAPSVTSAVRAASTGSKHHAKHSSASASASPSASVTASASASATATGAASGGGNGASSGGGSSNASGDGGLGSVPGGASPSPAVGLTPAASSSPAVIQAETVPVAAGTETWHSWILPLGFGLAIGAGAAGPFLRRRIRMGPR